MRSFDATGTDLAAMTVDVEDWFQVENLKPVVPRDSWETHELRVMRNTERMLQLLADRQLKCTFFVLGWVAERVPSLVRKIADAGHEIASHGFGHELIYHLSEPEFRADVARSKHLLEDIAGQRVCGYRAPSFSITDWAINVLQELDFTYDSSMFAALAHDRYGKLSNVDPTRPIYELQPGFTEVSISCLKLGGYGLPWGGGGYFRLIPYPIFKRGVRRILSTGQPYIFYLHPWEIDPEQPRMGGLKRSYRFRHYLNLDKCERRWSALLNDFRWLPINALLRSSDAPGATVQQLREPQAAQPSG